VPATRARAHAGRDVSPVRAKVPMKPPAKESPAPVGSTTLSSGKGGRRENVSPWKSSAPASPRLTHHGLGPGAEMGLGGRPAKLECPESWRASSSLSRIMSTRSSTRKSSARLPEIQKFHGVAGGKRGFFTWLSTQAEARDRCWPGTRRGLSERGGSLGLNVSKTLSWVSSVVRV